MSGVQATTPELARFAVNSWLKLRPRDQLRSRRKMRPAHTPATYNIRAAHGSMLAVGVSESEVGDLAQRVANALGETVWIFSVHSGTGTEVPPETK